MTPEETSSRGAFRPFPGATTAFVFLGCDDGVVRRPPTDFQLLRAVYERHLPDYTNFVDDEGREKKIAVPIDIPAIAAELDSDADTVFGRLYYHLDPQYEQINADGSRKHLFMKKAGDAANCINFPLLEAVLAGAWQERRRDLWTFWTAAASIGIAIGSLVVSIVALSST
jgi:hypothetical protein